MAKKETKNVSWTILKTLTKKAWVWLKTYWQVPFLLLWTVLVWVLTRKNSQAVIDVLEAKKTSYENQIIELNRSHSNELLKRDRLLEEYRATVSRVEEEFEKKKEKLTEKQKKTIKKIVLDSEGEPNAVKKEIESLFNFTYID